MNGYLLGVIGTVMLSALLTAITPEGKSSGVIKGVCKLVCVLAIVAPVLKFFQKGGKDEKILETFFSQSGIDTDEDVIKYYSELKVSLSETSLEEEIFKKFGVESEISYSWQTEESIGEIRITRIHLKIKGKCEEEVSKSMWEYLTKNYCSEVLIE